MCGGFQCSKNTLLGLNIVYVVSYKWNWHLTCTGVNHPNFRKLSIANTIMMTNTWKQLKNHQKISKNLKKSSSWISAQFFQPNCIYSRLFCLAYLNYFAGGSFPVDRSGHLWQRFCCHHQPSHPWWDCGLGSFSSVRGRARPPGHPQTSPDPPLRLHDCPFHHFCHSVLMLLRSNRIRHRRWNESHQKGKRSLRNELTRALLQSSTL